MMKRIHTIGAAAAAMAAAVALTTSATAQAPPPLNVPRDQPQAQYQQNPEQPEAYRDGRGWGDGGWRDDDWRGDDRRGDDWRGDRGRIDFQTAQRSCSRLGIQEAWNRNYYSGQYDGAPRFHEGRRGWELRGRMRLHDRSGYRFVDTACEVRRNGDAIRFDFFR